MAHLKSGRKRMRCQVPLWHVKFDAKGYVQQYLRSANHDGLL
jgi:hypothetical protein